MDRGPTPAVCTRRAAAADNDDDGYTLAVRSRCARVRARVVDRMPKLALAD